MWLTNGLSEWAAHLGQILGKQDKVHCHALSTSPQSRHLQSTAHMSHAAQLTAKSCVHFGSLAEHSPVSSRKYTAMLPILLKEFENMLQDCWKKILIFWSACNSIFSQHKYMTWESSNGVQRVVIRYSTKKSDQASFISLILPEKNIPPFTVTLYSCHHFLVVRTFVTNYFQGWCLGIVKFHQKYLTNSLRAH